MPWNDSTLAQRGRRKRTAQYCAVFAGAMSKIPQEREPVFQEKSTVAIRSAISQRMKRGRGLVKLEVDMHYTDVYCGYLNELLVTEEIPEDAVIDLRMPDGTIHSTAADSLQECTVSDDRKREPISFAVP